MRKVTGAGTREAGLDPSSPACCPYGRVDGRREDQEERACGVSEKSAGRLTKNRHRDHQAIEQTQVAVRVDIHWKRLASCASVRIEGVRGDHPRVRGEHTFQDRLGKLGKGSSPRARGARAISLFPRRPRGIIPACAGSTMSIFTRSPASGDHPRVRGEHDRPGLSPLTRMGSSPRARGAPTIAKQRFLAAGIIPACAGSTAYSLPIR